MNKRFFKREVWVGIQRYHQGNRVSIKIKDRFTTQLSSGYQMIDTDQLQTLVDYISSTKHNGKDVELVYEYEDDFQFTKLTIPHWAKQEVVKKLETLIEIEEGDNFYI